jgi:hypothetical protein
MTVSQGQMPADPPPKLALPDTIQTKASGIRPNVRSVEEALGRPAELRSLPRWTFARALFDRSWKDPQKSRRRSSGPPAKTGAGKRRLASVQARVTL